MQLKKNLVRNMVFPLIYRETMRWLRFYEKTQWWSYEKLEELQEKKIKKMINYVYNNVGYYRKAFKDRNLRPEDIRNAKDLERIPILTHQDVRQNLGDLISTNKPMWPMIRVQTTGTTGHPLILYKNRSETKSSEACLLRGWRWCGYRIGDKSALVWGRRLVFSMRASLRSKLVNSLARSVYINAWNLGEKGIEDIVKKLNTEKPTFLSGYVSPIYLLANFINQKGVNAKFNLNGISTTAEPLLSFQRKEIEKAFHCEVFDQYGSTEINSLGFECKEHTGLHIPIERVHVEFLDTKDDSPVSNGETGRIVVTCLENFGMPLIRYDTEDLGIKRVEPCSCGRNLPLMNSIIGRTVDLIRLPNGNAIFGGFFVYALEDLEWIAKYGMIQFQVVQKKLDHFILKIESQRKPSQQACESFLRLMKRHLGDVIFEIEVVDQIPVSSSGKRKYIISEVNPCASQE